MTIRVTKRKKPDYSKRLVSDIRALLWVVTVGSCYLSMAKSDHKEGGVTFEAAKAANFQTQDQTGSVDSPAL